MRSLAVKQQQTNRAQGFASGHNLGTCALVWVCDCFLVLFSGNYVKVTVLESFKVCLFHPQSHLKSHNIQIIVFVDKVCCLGFFLHWIPNCSSCSMYHISNIVIVCCCHFTATKSVLHLFFCWCVFLWKALKPQACEFVSVWWLVQIQIYTSGA